MSPVSPNCLKEQPKTDPQSTFKVSPEYSQSVPRVFPNWPESIPDSQKFVTRSVFELQKRVSTQNASPDNFQNILQNKILHRRPLTSIFGDCDDKTAVDSCSDIRIMIYILRLIIVPYFSWIIWSDAEI